MDDRTLMKEALLEAEAAYDRGECPVGAILVQNGKIVARAGNRESELHDPTAHAEVLVLRECLCPSCSSPILTLAGPRNRRT